MEFVGIAKFKIKPEYSDEQLCLAEKDIRKALAEQEGFLYRELGKFPDGYWIVSIHWTSKEAGSKWAENSKKNESVQHQQQMIDFATMRMEFYKKRFLINLPKINKMDKVVFVEIGKMKLKAGVTDEQFIEIERKTRNGKINQQPGFISREFGKDTDGYWYFRICWISKEAGYAWTPIFQQDPNGQAMMNALDFSTVRQEHYTVVNP